MKYISKLTIVSAIFVSCQISAMEQKKQGKKFEEFTPQEKFLSMIDRLDKPRVMKDENGNIIRDKNGNPKIYPQTLLQAFTLSARETLKGPNKLIQNLYNLMKYNGRKLKSEDHHSYPAEVALSHDNNYLVSAGKDARLWDITDKKDPVLLFNIEDWHGAVNSLEFSKDGNYIILSVGNYNEFAVLKLMDKNAKKRSVHPNVTQINNSLPKSIVVVAKFTQDGNYIVAGSSSVTDGTITIMDFTNKNLAPKKIKTLINRSSKLNSIDSIVISPDDKYIISGSYFGHINIWDIEDKKQINDDPIATLPNTLSVYSLAITRDGKYLAAGCDKEIKIWNLQNKKQIKNEPIAILEGYKGRPRTTNSLAITSDGNYIIAGLFDKTIKIWNVTDKNNIKTQPILTIKTDDSINSIAISHEGKYLAWGIAGFAMLMPMEVFKALEYVSNLPDKPNGIQVYILISDILKHYGQTKTPFEITLKRVKEIFNLIPEVLKQALIYNEFVTFKYIPKNLVT